MTKRILAMVLVLAMVLSLVPAVVLAEGTEVVASPKAETHTDAGHSDDCGLTSGWQEWTDGTTLPTAGQYVLKTDVNLTGDILMTGDLTLCLNGHVIKAAENKRIIGTMKNAESTLTITDCTAYTDENGVYQAGALTGGIRKSDGGGAIFVRRGGTLKVYDGRITGNTYQSDINAVGGGAVMLQDTSSGLISKAFIYGGEFSNNHSYLADGTTGGVAGAICVGKSAELTVEDGTFKDNSALNGGVIWANENAVVTIKGGLFTENTTTGKGYGGVMDMAGGAQLTITGGEFIGNTGFCGGVLNLRKNVVNITGAVFKENTATFGGSVIYIYGVATLTIGEGTVITENICTSTNAAEGYGAAVFHGSSSVNSKLTLTGKVYIAGNQIGAASIGDLNFRQSASDVLQLNELSEGSYVVFSTPKAAVTDPDDAANPIIKLNGTQTSWENDWLAFKDASGVRYVGYENGDFKFVDGHKHTLCNDTGCTDHTGQEIYQAWTDATKLPSDGNWFLVTDVTVSAEMQIKTATTLNLCLNGHTITGYTGKNARAYSTTKDLATTINISDCTAKTENGVYTAGKITGFTNTHTDSGAGGIYIRAGGTLNFYDGIIENCVSATGGAAIYVHTATANIYDGLITNNKALNGTTKKHGGGVFLYKATLNVYDGEISFNEADQGGGIYVRDSVVTLCGGKITNNAAAWGGGIAFANGNCTLDMQGGEITDNTASGNGGGVQGAYGAAVIKFSGDAIVTGNKLTDNTANNVRLGGSGRMTVGQLGSNARVGITATSGRALSNVLSNDLSAQFPSDNVDYVTYLNTDNQLQLKSSFIHVHCQCGKTDCTDSTHVQVEYDPWKDASSLPDSGNYCLLTDVTVSEEVEIKTATTLNLCLHGHTITGYTDRGARAYSTAGKVDAVINIADCTAKTENGVYTAGKFTGFNNTHSDSGGAAIYIRSQGTLNFYDGIIENCTAGSGGGAIYVHTATANIYGGLITGNKAILDTSWKSGGGIFLYKATLNLYGGQISNNEAAYGAGINLADGTCVLNVYGGKITNNVAQTNGAGIQAANTATVNISGEPVIVGNTLANGKANNLCLGSTGKVNVADLGENAQIGVTASVFRAISTETKDYTANFFSDDTKLMVIYQDNVLYMSASGNHKHCQCAGTVATGCEHNDQLLYVEWDDPTSLPTAGNYYLSVDVVINGQARLGDTTLNLCLNGHTIRVGDEGGRAYYMTNNSTLNIADCAGGGKFTGATLAAILTNASGTNMEINLYNGTFTQNHATGAGGALIIQGDCVFNMYGGFITGNSAEGYLVLDENGEVKLKDNGDQSYVSANGGGLYTASGTTFNMYGGEISGNKVTMIEYLKADATSPTKAGGNGGGMAIYGVANLYGGKVRGNQSDVSGGGIFVSSSGSVLNLMGTEICENTSAAGAGVISQTLAVINLSAGNVINNHATSAGGGIYVSTGTTLNMTGGVISGNISHNGTAWKNGGGMYLLASTANISGGKITGNKAANGGAISMGLSGTRYPTLKISDNALITGNTADTNGGAIFATGEGTNVTMTGGEISKNSAKNGGGIITQTKSSFTLTGGKFTGNTATTGGGGAIYISTNTHFTMTGGSVTGNSAPKNDGGGVYLYRSYATFKGGSISYNTAVNTGGLKINGAKVTISGLNVVGNTARGKWNEAQQKYTGGNAGGIMIGRAGYKKNGVQLYDLPTVTIYSIYLADNKSNAVAGGMLVQSDGTQFNMYGGTVCRNSAPNSNAGGIYFSTKSRPNVQNVSFYANTAKNAGAMYFLNTTGNLSNVKVYDNEVTTAAPAFIVTGADTVVEMKNMEIYDNVAQGAAGAFSVQGYATLNLEDAKIYGNSAGSTAGAVYFSNPGYGNFKNIELYENETQKEGGAMYVGPASIVKLDNVTIRDNVASGNYGGGIYIRGRLEIQNSKILNNETAGEGGGIATWKSSSILLGQDAGVYAENCVISGNEAGTRGGGVFNHRGGPIYMEGCTITDNTASAEGGGVYSDGRLGLVDATVTGNTSGGEGFAVYLTASEFDGHTYSTGHKKIGGNMIIKDNQGGDFYIGEGSGIAVVNGPLGEKTHMEITLHSGTLAEHLFGVYNYEGGDLVYTVTAGDRSLTDPEAYEYYQPEKETAQQDAQTEKTGSSDVLLYVGIGVIVLAVIAAAVLVVLKKKKAGKSAEKASKE